MNRRLDRARQYRARVDNEPPMRGVPLVRVQDLFVLGHAGGAVLELFEYCTGLAHAHDIEAPALHALSPMQGEHAGAWVDRCTADLATWHRAHFHGSIELTERELERGRRAEECTDRGGESEQHLRQRRPSAMVELVARFARPKVS